MKKFLLSFGVLCCFVTANAQTFRLGPTFSGSVNLSKETKARFGFAVGVRGEMNFKETEGGGFIDASVLLQKKSRCSEDYFNTETKINQHWAYSTCSVSLPVSAGYKFELSDNLGAFLALGPYVDFGLTGKSKVVTSGEDGKKSEKILSSNVYSDNLFNRVDFGLHAKVGFEICQHYRISLSYGRGFINLFKNGSNVKAQDLHLVFAYMF